MKERPLIVTTDLIPQILDGTKTNTRRTKGLEKYNVEPDRWRFGIMEVAWKVWWEASADTSWSYRVDCPYGQVGDELWVKETWKNLGNNEVTEPNPIYKADYSLNAHLFKWKPAIFMPRWASRITLEITGIRVERLQEIIYGGCLSEGITTPNWNIPPFSALHRWGYTEFVQGQYRLLWNSINKDYPWESNPWVWVIGFKKI